jgi:aquaporin Z
MKAIVAEVVGTFFLCFAGIAAILCNSSIIGSGAGLVGIALAHAFALSVAVSCFGGISGAHFNPAVTCGMLATGRIRFGMALLYVVAQLVGATLAAGVCFATFPTSASIEMSLGTPLPPKGLQWEWITPNVVLALEGVMTFLLMTAIFGTAVDERGKAVKIGGFGIGLAVAFDILAGGPITGASMNPARSFGPALIDFIFRLDGWQYVFKWQWCYWAGPIAGAVAAAMFYHHVLLDKPAQKAAA